MSALEGVPCYEGRAEVVTFMQITPRGMMPIG